MDDFIINYLSSLQFADMQVYKNMAAFPILTDINESPEYLILDEAIEQKLLLITRESC